MKKMTKLIYLLSKDEKYSFNFYYLKCLNKAL